MVDFIFMLNRCCKLSIILNNLVYRGCLGLLHMISRNNVQVTNQPFPLKLMSYNKKGLVYKNALITIKLLIKYLQ